MKERITSEGLYDWLAQRYPSEPWPAESVWEMMIGAFLAQNTTWHNAELSLAKIRVATQFDPRKIAQYRPEEWRPLIYSSGFHKNKSQLIYHFFQWLERYDFDLERIMAEFPKTASLRQQLLTFKGIGNETADTLLLYAFEREVFIADNYSRKLYRGLGFDVGDDYLALKYFVEQTTSLTLKQWQDFHLHILEFGKEFLVGRGPHQTSLFERYQIDQSGWEGNT